MGITTTSTKKRKTHSKKKLRYSPHAQKGLGKHKKIARENSISMKNYAMKKWGKGEGIEQYLG